MSGFGYRLLVYMGGGKFTDGITQVKQVSRAEVHTLVDPLQRCSSPRHFQALVSSHPSCTSKTSLVHNSQGCLYSTISLMLSILYFWKIDTWSGFFYRQWTRSWKTTLYSTCSIKFQLRVFQIGSSLHCRHKAMLNYFVIPFLTGG